MAIISADIWQGERESRGSLKSHISNSQGDLKARNATGRASKSFICRDVVSTRKYELVALALPAI